MRNVATQISKRAINTREIHFIPRQRLKNVEFKFFKKNFFRITIRELLHNDYYATCRYMAKLYSNYSLLRRLFVCIVKIEQATAAA